MMATVRALVVLLVAACESAPGPQPPPSAERATAVRAEAARAEPPAAASLTGWWRSDGLCLELFANGDFELSVMEPGPKVLVMGTAAQVATAADAFDLRMTVARIWHARFTGPCRRTHELGEWAEEQEALGVRFAPGGSATLKLARKDGALEVCGASCARLEPAAPVLGGRWRLAGLENASRPTVTFAAGDLVELAIRSDGGSAHLWTAKDATSWDVVDGSATAVPSGPDRFRVMLTPRDDGAAVALEARRLPGERLEVCARADRCATLERLFDAYDHDLR